MACCLIALMLLAQCAATLRRWGAFWGLVRVPEGIEYETVFDHAKRWMAKPAVRAAVAVAVVVEIGAVGSWIYIDHRHHIANIAQDVWARATGHEVIYAAACDSHGNPRDIRTVIDTDRTGLRLLN